MASAAKGVAPPESAAPGCRRINPPTERTDAHRGVQWPTERVACRVDVKAQNGRLSPEWHSATLRARGRENSAIAMKTKERQELLETLKARFEKNVHRHPEIAWADVAAKLEAHPEALRSLHRMEATGGEPDVIGVAGGSGAFIFCDCSPESPGGRRSTCYDADARAARKEHRPESSALEMAGEMGIDLLTEERYRELQTLGEFDTKTSSWIATPPEVRALGGALFCDRRYGKVFVYHNGAQSYYAARGCRGSLHV
jgi:hypothetical protein